MFDAARPDFAKVPRPAFGRAEQHQPRTLGPTTKARARYARMARTAAELLPDLPAPGEAIHAVMLGFFDLCQVITATAERLPSLARLRIATLCYSRRNSAELLGLLAARPSLVLNVVVSHFFKDHNPDLYEELRAGLAARPGSSLTPARSHCKVVCFDVAPGDGLVFEGSANLRTNRNREQLTVIRDRVLHDWHAAWMDDLAAGKHGAQESPRA